MNRSGLAVEVRADNNRMRSPRESIEIPRGIVTCKFLKIGGGSNGVSAGNSTVLTCRAFPLLGGYNQIRYDLLRNILTRKS